MKNFSLSLFSGPEFNHVFIWLKGEIDNYAHTLIMQCDFKMGNKPKKFDFVHQTVSRREVHAGGA